MTTTYTTDVEDLKNSTAAQIEKVDSSDSYIDPIIHDVGPEEHRRIMRKVDFRLVPLVGSMYCVSLLDRTNLGAAVIAGMSADLELAVGTRYSLITLVFFITYVLCQPPATVLIRKIGPRIFISVITLLWGATMIGFGFVHNWTTMLALRVILGIFEAGFFPGVVYLLSTWYVRYDVGKRYAFFYFVGACTSGFGGILAYGLMQMQGLAGLHGWRWIFIIEGVLTCVLALVGYIFLVSFPDDTSHKQGKSFVTERERRYIIARVQADRDDAYVEPFSFGKWISAGADAKIWGFAIIFGCSTTITYALAYFLPIILREGMGFSLGMAECLIAPPYVFAGFHMITVAWLSDKYHQRGIAVAWNALIGLIGLVLMGYTSSVGVRYFGVFLAAAGANSNVPLAMTYQANNIRGQWKRAFCSATLVGMGGVGGIVGSTVFRSQDAPGYKPGLLVCIGACVLTILIVGALTLKFRRDNKRADQGKIVIEGAEHGFRYTY